MKKFEQKKLEFIHTDDLIYVKSRDPRFEVRAILTDHNEEIPLHYHDDMEITCQLSGSSTHYINGKEYVLTAGQVIIINNKVPHYNLPLTNEEDQVFVVIVSNTYLNNIVIESGFDQSIIELKNNLLYNHFDHPLKLSSKLRAIIDDMIANVDEDKLDIIPFKQRLLISLFILEFGNLEFDTKFLKTNDKLDLISFIYSNLKTATLNNYAKQINYSTSYVSRRIKQDYGLSFMDILIEVRLQNAARLLISTDYSVEKIMSDIGYNNKTHFYDLFKKRYFVTPLTYRKRNKK